MQLQGFRYFSSSFISEESELATSRLYRHTRKRLEARAEGGGYLPKAAWGDVYKKAERDGENVYAPVVVGI